MNIERIITMLARRLMKRGVNAGIGHVARRGKAPGEMTPQERQRAAAMRQQAKRARQTARMMRRLR